MFGGTLPMQNIHRMSETPVLGISILTLNVLLLSKTRNVIYGLIFSALPCILIAVNLAAALSLLHVSLKDRE